MSFGGRANFAVNQGATLTILFQLLDSSGIGVPISACSGKMRKNIGDTVPTATLNCAVNDPTNGIAQAVLSAIQSAAIVLPVSLSGERDSQAYFYDILCVLADGVTVIEPLYGVITVAPTVDY